jgi:hypothetical protein
MTNKFKAFLFALVILGPGCSKRIHDSIKLDINSNEPISATIKVNKSIHLRMKHSPCRDRIYSISYPITQLNEYSYGYKKNKYFSFALYESKSENFLLKFIDLYLPIDSVEYHSPSVVIMRTPDTLEIVKVVKVFNLNNEIYGLVLEIQSNKPDAKIQESEIRNLLYFVDNIEIVGIETYVNKCQKTIILDFSKQQSD